MKKILNLCLAMLLLPTLALAASGSFQDNSNNEDGFKVERNVGGGAFAVVLTLGGNVVSFTDVVPNPAPGGLTYCYRVISFNGAGDAAPSNTSCITTPVVIQIPAGATNLTVTFDAPGAAAPAVKSKPKPPVKK